MTIRDLIVFLKMNNALGKFFTNLEKQRGTDAIAFYFENWQWQSAFDQAFLFSESEEGISYWLNIMKAWIECGIEVTKLRK